MLHYVLQSHHSGCRGATVTIKMLTCAGILGSAVALQAGRIHVLEHQHPDQHCGSCTRAEVIQWNESLRSSPGVPIVEKFTNKVGKKRGFHA